MGGILSRSLALRDDDINDPELYPQIARRNPETESEIRSICSSNSGEFSKPDLEDQLSILDFYANADRIFGGLIRRVGYEENLLLNEALQRLKSCLQRDVFLEKLAIIEGIFLLQSSPLQAKLSSNSKFMLSSLKHPHMKRADVLVRINFVQFELYKRIGSYSEGFYFLRYLCSPHYPIAPGRRVLVVTEDVLFGIILRRVLKQALFDAVLVISSHDALRELVYSSIDVVLVHAVGQDLLELPEDFAQHQEYNNNYYNNRRKPQMLALAHSTFPLIGSGFDNYLLMPCALASIVRMILQ
jgi:hypothetical protein